MNTCGKWWRSAQTGFAISACVGCASTPMKTATPVDSTDRGVVTVVFAPLEQTAEWTTRAFQDLGIRLAGVESDLGAREYEGTRADLSVRAALTSEPPDRTRIEITARNGDAAFDPTYARRVLQRIVRHAH
jgi:hypothetical protein